MKKILAVLLVTSFMMACNSGDDKEKAAATGPAAETQHEQEQKATGLVLNNGAKWKADSTTLLNVSLLQNIVSGAKKVSLDNFTQTAVQLQDGLNKMVNECKMKGADHDALHQWLEPLMGKTNDLKKTTSAENAAATLNEIDKHLQLFAKYFE